MVLGKPVSTACLDCAQFTCTLSISVRVMARGNPTSVATAISMDLGFSLHGRFCCPKKFMLPALSCRRLEAYIARTRRMTGCWTPARGDMFERQYLCRPEQMLGLL